MIVYNSKKWSWFFISLSKTYKQSFNLRLLVRFMLVTAIYTTAITILSIHYLRDAYSIDPVFFSLIGVILSLFLVFRLNTGYERWWKGREAWGKLINDTRTLALQMDAILPQEDIQNRRFFSRHISNFCMSLAWHLRDDMDKASYILEEGETREDISSATHHPNRIASFLYQEIDRVSKSNDMSDMDKYHAKTLVQGFIDVTGMCERIKKTPIPFSHSAFINIFIVIYILILPFGLVNMFDYLTIPGVLVMSFAMLGIEVISEEIENPFGEDANDLPTGTLAETIRANVYEILQVEPAPEFKAKKRQNVVAEILH